ncbi:MAG: hypothetical protein L0Y35_03775, partial [Flammeovirgaceae bacterium]|nr:hypothetical protein [Flammeovirgaceae bacterium]
MRAAFKIIFLTLCQFIFSCNDDSISPNDGLIAFTFRDENDKLQIFTITPDGTNQKQLTFEGENGRPDWSPDGKK